MIDYKKEFINLLKNTTFSTLPKQELIDDSEEIATLAWTNFYSTHDYENYKIDLVEDYLKYDVKTIFSSYKENTSFWKNIIEKKYSKNYMLLFNQNFQKDFNKVYNDLCCDKEFIFNLYENFQDKTILNIANISESEKLAIIKKNLLKIQHISFSSIKDYIDDKKFLIEILKKNSSLNIYPNLPLELQEDKDIIKLSVYKNNWTSFLNLPNHLQEAYFPLTQSWSKENISLTDVKKFDMSIQKDFIRENKQFLESLLINKRSTYTKVAIELLSEDLQYIEYFSDSNLDFIKKHINSFIPLMEEYAKNFKGEINKRNVKIINFINSCDETRKILKENFNYKIAYSYFKGEKISKETFDYFILKIIEKYEFQELKLEEAENMTQSLRKSLSIEYLKELKLPKKDCFDILYKKYLVDKLETNLEKKNKSTLAFKI